MRDNYLRRCLCRRAEANIDQQQEQHQNHPRDELTHPGFVAPPTAGAGPTEIQCTNAAAESTSSITQVNPVSSMDFRSIKASTPSAKSVCAYTSSYSIMVAHSVPTKASSSLNA